MAALLMQDCVWVPFGNALPCPNCLHPLLLAALSTSSKSTPPQTHRWQCLVGAAAKQLGQFVQQRLNAGCIARLTVPSQLHGTHD